MVEMKLTGFLDDVLVGQVSKAGKAMPDAFLIDSNGMPVKIISWRVLPAIITTNKGKDVNVTVKVDAVKTTYEGKEYTNYTLIEVLSVTPIGKPVCAADKPAMAAQDAKVAEVQKEVQAVKDANAEDAKVMDERNMDESIALAIKLADKYRSKVAFTGEDVRAIANSLFISKSQTSRRYLQN